MYAQTDASQPDDRDVIAAWNRRPPAAKLEARGKDPLRQKRVHDSDEDGPRDRLRNAEDVQPGRDRERKLQRAEDIVVAADDQHVGEVERVLQREVGVVSLIQHDARAVKREQHERRDRRNLLRPRRAQPPCPRGVEEASQQAARALLLRRLGSRG